MGDVVTVAAGQGRGEGMPPASVMTNSWGRNLHGIAV